MVNVAIFSLDPKEQEWFYEYFEKYVGPTNFHIIKSEFNERGNRKTKILLGHKKSKNHFTLYFPFLGQPIPELRVICRLSAIQIYHFTTRIPLRIHFRHYKVLIPYVGKQLLIYVRYNKEIHLSDDELRIYLRNRFKRYFSPSPIKEIIIQREISAQEGLGRLFEILIGQLRDAIFSKSLRCGKRKHTKR